MKSLLKGQPHHKALTKIIDRLVDSLLAKELELQNDIDLLRAGEDSVEKLARMQDLSSRRYQVKQLKRDFKKVLEDSGNLLIASITPKLNN